MIYNRHHYWEGGEPADAVYVGRPSPWGNPFVAHSEVQREKVIKHFEEYAISRLKREPHWLDPLRGKDLVCWCAPKKCHAEVLERLANS